MNKVKITNHELGKMGLFHNYGRRILNINEYIGGEQGLVEGKSQVLDFLSQFPINVQIREYLKKL